jgi:predicted nucleotidyltransferase
VLARVPPGAAAWFAAVLVAFASGARRGLVDLVETEDELTRLFGRRVDLVTRRGVEDGDNWLRLRAILDSAVALPGIGACATA